MPGTTPTPTPTTCARCSATIVKMRSGDWSTGYPSHLAITCDGVHLHTPAI